MSDRPFSPVTGEAFKVENYYFQVIPVRLNVKTQLPVRTVDYILTVFKGSKKFEASKKIPLTLEGSSFALEGIRLNFVIINYNPSRLEHFALRLSEAIIERNKDIEKQLGEYVIDGNRFVDHFLRSENGAFKLQAPLNDYFSVDLELYVDKSRYGLERLIKNIKNPRPKTPEQKEITHQVISASTSVPTLQPLQEEESYRVEPRSKVQEKSLWKEQKFNQRFGGLKQTEQEQYKPYPEMGMQSLIVKRNKFEGPANMLKSQTFPVSMSQPKPKEEVKVTPKEEVKVTRTKKVVIIQQQWHQKLPFNIKLAIPILILLLIGLYLTFGQEEPQKPLFPKAPTEKIDKTVRKTKTKKSKK